VTTLRHDALPTGDMTSSPQARTAATIFVAIGAAVAGFTVLAMSFDGAAAVPGVEEFGRALRPVFLVTGVVQVLAHVIVAIGLAAGWSWARIGGMVLCGMGLFTTVPALVMVAAVPRSADLTAEVYGIADPRLVWALFALNALVTAAYVANLVLLARLEAGPVKPNRRS
jgi:hypothetical protein